MTVESVDESEGFDVKIDIEGGDTTCRLPRASLVPDRGGTNGVSRDAAGNELEVFEGADTLAIDVVLPVCDCAAKSCGAQC